MYNQEGTPEHYLSVKSPSIDTGKLDIDALNCALARAEALCTLLLESERIEADDVISKGVWALSGVIDQASAIASGS